MARALQPLRQLSDSSWCYGVGNGEWMKHKPGRRRDLRGDSGKDLLLLVHTLGEIVKKQKITLLFVQEIGLFIGNAISGRFNGYEREIKICTNGPVLREVNTLIHEIAHVYVYDLERKWGNRIYRNYERESICEIASNIVARSFGFKRSDVPGGYMAYWLNFSDDEESTVRIATEQGQLVAAKIITDAIDVLQNDSQMPGRWRMRYRLMHLLEGFVSDSYTMHGHVDVDLSNITLPHDNEYAQSASSKMS